LTSTETKSTLDAFMNEMRWKEFALQLAAIVAVAVVCALVANAMAANERKLVLVGHYPNALSVTRHDDSASVAMSTTTPASSPVATMPGTVGSPAVPAMAPNVTTENTTRAAAPVVDAHPVKPSPAAPVPAASNVVTPSPVRPAAKAAPTEAELLARFPTHEKVAYVEIGGTDVAWLHAAGVPFLDARRSSVYEEGHIAGARSFPVWEADVDERIKGLLNEGRDGKLPIVVYCSGGDCEDSHMLAEKLWGVFFNDVLVYKDGFPDWQKRGGPIHTGSAP
jgi:rhodanese-related sulfurtransferase